MCFARRPGFTVVELLVVVSIIALLLGILLPAMGKARDQARLTLSQTNLRNLATALATYGAEWNDRQPTFIDDNIATYGPARTLAFPAWHEAHGGGLSNEDFHPPIILGWGATPEGYVSNAGLWAYWMSHPGNWFLTEPIVFEGSPSMVGFGSFRIPNARQLSMYLSGRFYDPIFYAPKDTEAVAAVATCFESPEEFCVRPDTGMSYWSSYCFSPAAMFNVGVMRNAGRGGWQDPWDLPAGFRSPSLSQARYPSLKTQMLEHHWLQQRRSVCNPAFEEGNYNGCEPWYFNHSWESAPVTVFFDGHVAVVGVRQAEAADHRMRTQTDNADWGLWSNDTPLGGSPDGGYFMDAGYDFVQTSFHVLTTDGIRGRDITGG